MSKRKITWGGLIRGAGVTLAMAGGLIGTRSLAEEGMGTVESKYEFVAPVMTQVPLVDGVFHPDEWAQAVGFDGMVWQGALEERAVQAYIGASSDAFYLAMVSELPPVGALLCTARNANATVVNDDAAEVFITPVPDAAAGITYQALFNPEGTVAYLAHVWGGHPAPEAWNGDYEIRQSREGGRWVAEIRIPLTSVASGRSITDGTWAISLCRDWKQPWVFSSAPGAFNGKDTRFRFAEGAPAIQFKHTGDWFDKDIKEELSILNTGATPLELDTLIRTDMDLMPSVRESRRVCVEPNEVVTLPYDATSHTPVSTKFDFSLNVSREGSVLYSRAFKWGAKRKARWETVREKVLPIDFEFAYYPTRNRLRVCNRFQNNTNPLPERVTYTVKNKTSGEVVYSFSTPSATGLETAVSLPPLDGEYLLTLNAGGEELAKAFERKRYAWEGNSLGTSRKVYPPFTDIEVEGNRLSTVYRTHTLGASGLPEQITAKGIDLLAGPIVLRQNGKAVPASPLVFKEKAADVVVTESVWQADGVKAVAAARWEYDGCLRYDLTLSPAGTGRLDRLVLEIPLKDALAPMFHAMGDGIRNTRYDVLPEGQGEVWNASAVNSYDMPPNFCTYLFLGSQARGLCFFAENDKGWSWDRSTPNLRVIRDGVRLTLEVDLVNKPAVLDAPRTLSFGLLAAPVKPRFDDWRSWWTVEKWSILGTDINWLGGPGNCANVYPFGRDEYFWEMIARGNTEKVLQEELKACVERADVYLRPFGDYEKKRASLERHVNFNVGGSRLGKTMIFYYNRSVFNALDEYSTFMNEWRLKDFPSRQYPSSCDEIRIVPSDSYSDFALYWYDRSFNYRNRGVYWDNWFYAASFNTEMTDAYQGEDGTVTPAVGLWGLRDLAKRTFQMMNEKGMRPVTMAHMTSTAILPALSFCTVQYDWEWKYSEGDVQYRFSRPYCQLVSNGELAGAVPVLLHDHGKDATDEWVQRTFVGVSLVHELTPGVNGPGSVWKTLREPMVDRYLAVPNVQATRYWDDQAIVRSEDPDIAWILYSLPDEKAVLVLCSYKETDSRTTFSLDLKALGLSAESSCVNFETGAAISQVNGRLTLPLSKHEVLAVEFRNP